MKPDPRVLTRSVPKACRNGAEMPEDLSITKEQIARSHFPRTHGIQRGRALAGRANAVHGRALIPNFSIEVRQRGKMLVARTNNFDSRFLGWDDDCFFDHGLTGSGMRAPSIRN